MSTYTDGIFSEIEWEQIRTSFAERPFYETYRLIANIAEGRKGASTASIIWLTASANVNQGIGPVSDFIRDYSSKQYKLRYDQSLDTSLVQQASDDIAQTVINDIIENNYIPGIQRLADDDARPAAERLFEGDASGWAGNPAFVYLGVTNQLVNNVLTPEGDTYDALAMLKFVLETGGWSALVNAFKTLAQNYGFTIDDAFYALRETNAFLSSSYGYQLLDLKSEDYMIGNLERTNTLSGDDSNEVLRGGNKDDVLMASSGYDILDGGKGTDTADFSGDSQKINVIFQKVSSPASFVAKVWGQGTADLYSIEKIKGTSQDDNFELRSLSSSLSTLEIDAGGGEEDIFSARNSNAA